MVAFICNIQIWKPTHIDFYKNEWDCKPGSVVNDHLSGINVTANLKRPTWEQIGQIYGPLFGLASDGVYRALHVTTQAVVSYTAFPPLPFARRFISVALSLESPPPDVIRHPALWSPDFPHPQKWPRLSVLLYPFDIIAKNGDKVNLSCCGVWE